MARVEQEYGNGDEMRRSNETIRAPAGEQVEPVESISESTGPLAESLRPVGLLDPRDYERLERDLQSLTAGIARLERKLDRILALSVESRGRR